MISRRRAFHRRQSGPDWKRLIVMQEAPISHPSPERLAAFDGGMLSPDERAAVERHVASCAACCERLDALPDDPLAALLRASSAGDCGPTQTFHASSCETPTSPSSAIPETPPELVNYPRYRIV